MTKRSSFLLAVLLIANPFMLLFYQNCSTAPRAVAQDQTAPKKIADRHVGGQYPISEIVR